jgi:hypothetical protein
MARLLSITRSETLDPTVRKRTIQMPFRIGPMTLSILTIILIGFLSLFFIISTTTTSAQGFQLHSLEQRALDLREQNQRLEVEASKLRALDKLEQTLKDNKTTFVPVSKVSTIRLPEEAVAVTNP